MESAILRHAEVDEVAVYAVPSEVTEDDVKITVVLSQGSEMSEEELCLWIIDEVPYYAVPRFIEFSASLPKSAVGRVYKYELRDRHDPSLSWDREQAGIELVR
jgi:crotonobetaine/carnitine-CoA ligase